MTSSDTKRRQNTENQRDMTVGNKSKPSVKRCTMRTKIIRDIFNFLHDNRSEYEYKGMEGSEQTKMSVLLSLFQPGVITRLKPADVRVDDPNFIDGSVITADFLLHIDFDKLLRQVKKLNDSYAGLNPVFSTASILRPVCGTDAMCLTLTFKRNPVRHVFSRIGDMFRRMAGIDNMIDIMDRSYDITAVLCGAMKDEDGGNRLFALSFDDTMMRMNEKKLINLYWTMPLSLLPLFSRTGSTMKRILYDTVNRRINHTFESISFERINHTFERNGEPVSKNNHESTRQNTTVEGCKISDPDSIICHICTGGRSVFYKVKNAVIKWLEK